MKLYRSQLLFTLLLLLSTSSYATEFLLTKINYNIEGPTKPFFLETRFHYHEGMTFSDNEELELFISDLHQEMENLRLYNNIIVTSDKLENKVTLNITLKEAWSIIPFPYPKYSSETGGRLAMKLFWNNTFGTLTNTLIQGGVNIGQNPDTSKLELQTWDTSISTEGIYLFKRFFNIRATQSLENDSKDEKEWAYYETDFSFGTTFNILDKFDYSPSISIAAKYNYKSLYDSVDIDTITKTPLSLSYSHGIGNSKINWIGNFRDGYKYGLGNTLSILRDSDNKIFPDTSFSLSGSYFKTFGSLPISLGIQGSTILSVNQENLGLASNIRGVESGALYGYKGIFINNNIYIRTIKIKGIAEAIFAPFFDIGVTDNWKHKYGSGADFILYVDKLKSMVARGTIGWDLTDFSPRNFTIDITSSLFF